MTELDEELQILLVKELQKKWDRALLSDFYEKHFRNVGQLAAFFIKQNQISSDAFNLLLRVPRMKHHSKTESSRFVTAYLPSVAKYAWKLTKNDIDKLVDALSKTKKVDTKLEPTDKFKTELDRGEINRGRKKYYQARSVSAIKQDMWNSQKLSGQWGVTK